MAITVTKSQINMAPLSTFTCDGTDMGGCKGGADFEIAVEMINIMVDQLDGIVKKLITQVGIKGTVRISQEVFSKFGYFMQGGTLLPATTIAQGGGLAPGTTAREVALILSNGKHSLSVWKAVFSGNYKKKFVLEEGGEVIEMDFEGVLDSTKTAGNQLYKYEDLVS